MFLGQQKEHILSSPYKNRVALKFWLQEPHQEDLHVSQHHVYIPALTQHLQTPPSCI